MAMNWCLNKLSRLHPTAPSVTFDVPSDKAGRFDYRLETATQPGELRDDNNSRDMSLQVVDNKARVLLVEGDARWEFRYLKNLLDRDKQVEPLSVLLHQPFLNLLNQPYIPKQAAGHRKPLREQLAKTDLLIMGDVDPQDIGPGVLGNDRTGSDASDGLTLLMIPGRNHMPQEFQSPVLSGLLPVSETRQRVAEKISRDTAGRRTDFVSGCHWEPTPPTCQCFNWQQILQTKTTPSPTCRGIHGSLVVSPNLEPPSGRPRQFRAWTLHRNPQSCIRIMASVRSSGWDSTAPGAGVGELATNGTIDNVRLSLSDVVIDESETIEATVRWNPKLIPHLKDAAVEVVATLIEPPAADSPGNMKQSPDAAASVEHVTLLIPSAGAPERYIGRLPRLSAGAWNVHLRVTGGDLTVDDSIQSEVLVRRQLSQELANVSCNRELLAQLAELTRGAVVEPWEVARLVDLVQPEDSPEEKVREVTLWDHWVVVLVFFGLLTSEWVLRKLNGLP